MPTILTITTVIALSIIIAYQVCRIKKLEQDAMKTNQITSYASISLPFVIEAVGQDHWLKNNMGNLIKPASPMEIQLYAHFLKHITLINKLGLRIVELEDTNKQIKQRNSGFEPMTPLKG